MILSLFSLIVAIGCYSISQLLQHGKFKWMSKDPLGFWGENMDDRKYKLVPDMGQKEKIPGIPRKHFKLPPPNNWYYRFNKDLKYKEKFPLSGTLLSWTTDGYHFCQMIMFLSLSFGISQLINIYGVWDFPLVWIAILLIHWLTRRLLSK